MLALIRNATITDTYIQTNEDTKNESEWLAKNKYAEGKKQITRKNYET
jgi:hypothetical protein